MNKPQFDFSKQAKVPDEWIEKALAIPSVCPKQPARPVFPRRAVAAASIVLITVLSVSLFFFSGNKRQPEIAPAPKATEVAAPTADISSVWNDSEPTRFAAVSPEPTENSSASAAASASPQETSASSLSPTQPASQSSETRPAGTVAPTERPINAETQPQAEDPSNAAGGGVEHPSENPMPIQPSESSLAEPCVVSCQVSYDQFYAAAPDNDPNAAFAAVESDDCYCYVCDEFGVELGSSNPYDASHMATVEYYQDYCLLSYSFTPTTAHVQSGSGVYYYTFCNAAGEVIASGTFYP